MGLNFPNSGNDKQIAAVCEDSPNQILLHISPGISAQ